MEGHKLAADFDEHNENAQYWTDGKTVFYRRYEIKGVDIDSFEQFPGSWAKDKKHCYLVGHRLQNADPATFEVLNFTYAKDLANVWTLGGRIADADAATFEVCDSGRLSLGPDFERLPDGTKKWYEHYVPYGYGKDKNNVYHYDYSGKPNIVKKAVAASFRSLDDGYFGYDEKSVFCKQSALPKANPSTWAKLHENYYYSRDRDRIYYFNRPMKEADAETFEVIVLPVATGTPDQLAKDRNTGYTNDRPISFEELEKYIADECEHYERCKEK